MLLRIIHKEMLSHILTLRFGVTLVLFIVLVFASIFVSVNEYMRNKADYDAQVRTSRQRLDELAKETDLRDRYRRLVREGRIDPVPVAELSWLAQGLQPYWPLTFLTSPRGTSGIERGANRNPVLGLLRVPDFVYVVSVVLSLLAILFMFDAVCGEKETGTLRLMLANATPRHTVLLGKWLGGYVLLIVPFLVSAAAGVGYVWVRGALQPGSEQFLRIAALMLVACLYIAVFFNLSLFISTATHRSPTALLLCVIVWVGFILVIPNMAPITAKIIRPMPPSRVLIAEKRAVEEEFMLKRQQLALTGALSYGQTTQQAQEQLQKEFDREIRRLEQYFERLQTSQFELSSTLARLSPCAQWTFAAVNLTNTGMRAYQRVEQARQQLLTQFDQFRDTYYRRWRESRNGDPPEFSVDELPSLRVALPTFADALNSSLNDVLILTILNVLFFMLAFVFFLRYDVT